MTTRTTSETMTFFRPFKLSGMDGEQPAGRYMVETDEDLIESLSFPVYRRTATYINLPRITNGASSSEMIRIDPVELQAAVSAGLETALNKTTIARGTEATLADLLAGSTVLQAIDSAQLTLDEFKARFELLQSRWQDRSAVDQSLQAVHDADSPS